MDRNSVCSFRERIIITTITDIVVTNQIALFTKLQFLLLGYLRRDFSASPTHYDSI